MKSTGSPSWWVVALKNALLKDGVGGMDLIDIPKLQMYINYQSRGNPAQERERSIQTSWASPVKGCLNTFCILLSPSCSCFYLYGSLLSALGLWRRITQDTHIHTQFGEDFNTSWKSARILGTHQIQYQKEMIRWCSSLLRKTNDCFQRKCVKCVWGGWLLLIRTWTSMSNKRENTKWASITF